MLFLRRFVIALATGSLFAHAALAAPSTDIAALAPAPLHNVYAARQFEPLWLDHGRPTPKAEAAIQALAHADEDGLHVADYGVTSLNQQLTALQQNTGSDRQQADFDLALSNALVQYTSDMTVGRVQPIHLGLDIDISANQARLPAHIRRILAGDDLPAAMAQLQPTMPPYATLRQLLAQYRLLATAHPEPPTLPPLPDKKLKPGTAWDGNAALASWLVTLGDMPANSPVGALYDGILVEGVKHFQTRHGLTADGVVGKQTWEALQIPLPHRVQQLEWAMERLRWIDNSIPTQQRFIVVNIPQFTLWAYVPTPEGPRSEHSMRVVVGTAGKNETPVMTKTLSNIVFKPYWNVPRSIAMKELLPKLRRDPAYLDHESMELVDRDGDTHGSYFDETQEDQLISGEYRIRQRAGDKNALGKLKFVFPNNDSIYMHDTPSKNLFAKDRRDFSHGCIRVGDPMGLALFALQTQGEWDEAKVNEKIAVSTDQHLTLKERMPVLLLYLTANTDQNGQAMFFQDIYHQDEPLMAALKTRKLVLAGE